MSYRGVWLLATQPLKHGIILRYVNTTTLWGAYRSQNSDARGVWLLATQPLKHGIIVRYAYTTTLWDNIVHSPLNHSDMVSLSGKPTTLIPPIALKRAWQIEFIASESVLKFWQCLCRLTIQLLNQSCKPWT